VVNVTPRSSQAQPTIEASPALTSSVSRFNDRLPWVSVMVIVHVPLALSTSNESSAEPCVVVLFPSCVHVQEPDGGEPVEVRAHVQLASAESLPGALTPTTNPSSAWASSCGSEIVRLAQSLHQQPLLEVTEASVSSSSQPDLRNEWLTPRHFPITFMPEDYRRRERGQGGTGVVRSPRFDSKRRAQPC
jgi:hypothetical protein